MYFAKPKLNYSLKNTSAAWYISTYVAALQVYQHVLLNLTSRSRATRGIFTATSNAILTYANVMKQ